MGVKLISSGGGAVEIISASTASAFTVTMPATTGTVLVTTVPVSAIGQVLFSTDGTSFTPTAKLVSGTVVSATSGTSIDFTGIPSWAKRVVITFNVVSTSGTSPPQIQIGSGSIVTSGYSGSAGSLVGTTVGAASYTTGFGIMNNAHTAVATISGAITLSLHTGNTWVASGVTAFDGGGVRFTGGVVALSGALDRARITTVNGTDTFDAGSINILYE